MKKNGETRMTFVKGLGFRLRWYPLGSLAPDYTDHELSKLVPKNRPFLFLKGADDFSAFKLLNPDYQFFELGCGQCIQCRLSYSRQWASRIVCENLVSKSSAFVTLTYSDDHLPISGKSGVPTLLPDDVSAFMKRLRRSSEYHFGFDADYPIRFFAAGEYGSKTSRPHYHLCLFNLPELVVAQNKFFASSFEGDPYYTNQFLSDCWQKGHVIVGDLTFQSAAYVARYVTKKMKGEKSSVYSELSISPEFSRVSNRPGLGRSFFEEHKNEIYQNDELFLPGSRKLAPPRYFDKLYAFEDPAFMEILKAERSSRSERAEQFRLDHTDMSFAEYLKSQQITFESTFKKLPRPLD